MLKGSRAGLRWSFAIAALAMLGVLIADLSSGRTAAPLSPAATSAAALPVAVATALPRRDQVLPREAPVAAAAPAFPLRPRWRKTDLTEAASDDDGADGSAPMPAPAMSARPIPAPPPGPDAAPNPAQRDPNVVYKPEGAADDEGG